jgi:POT family proton-dependent oligopeptide transporter
MASAKYRTSPDHETKAWPPGVPYIIGNEGCERFSYYGMRSILTVHLVALFAMTGLTTQAAEANATAMAHIFFAGVYAFPMIGALVADRLVGKYNTILWLSLVYCAGHAVLAFAEGSLQGMAIGLGLIAVGSGGIKPCVSANVGDQFGRGNWFRVKTIFQAFYFIINFGSFFATLLIPLIRAKVSTAAAFGLPGILMFIATIFFWAGRNKYVHVPPKPGGKVGALDTLAAVSLFMSFGHLLITAKILHWAGATLVFCSIGFLVLGLILFTVRQRVAPDDGFMAVLFYSIRQRFSGARQAVAPAGDRIETDHPLYAKPFWRPAVLKWGGDVTEATVAVIRVVSVFFLVSVFWALFEQHGSTWIIQAKAMNLHFLGMDLLPSQIAALNPLMVMLFIPMMNGFYNLSERLGYEPTSLRRMTIGMGITATSFAAIALIQMRIEALGPGVVSVGWQIIPYILVTIAEVMVSITGLEFAYTQAPRRMKSTVMGFWMLTVSLGQVLVTLLASLEDLPRVKFFWIFTAMMAAAAVLFGIRARFYKTRDYTQ